MILVFTDSGRVLMERLAAQDPSFDTLFFLQRSALALGGSSDYYEQVVIERAGSPFFLDVRYTFDEYRVKIITSIELFDASYQKVATALDINVPVSAGSLFYRDDILYLTGADDSIYDGGGSDFIDLGPGDDLFVYGGGNDQVFGGSGMDTITINTFHEEVRIGYALAGITVTTAEGKITFSEVERVQFLDFTLALDVGNAVGQVYRLYQAAFDRVPDTAGLSFWVHQSDYGMTLRHIAGELIKSSEFASLYGVEASDAAFIDALYMNVLGRGADEGGLAFYENWLADAPHARPDVLIAFSESAENVALTGGALAFGVLLDTGIAGI
jgi:hypothetical protein